MTHQWNVTPSQAIAIQKKLRNEIIIQKFNKSIRFIGGADISFTKYDPVVYAGIMVFSYPDLKPLSYSLIKQSVSFPYIPGLLSFREIPPLLTAWEQLKTKPDILVLDGQGIAHPQRLGIATHFGIVANTATIGFAKNPLVKIRKQPSQAAGSMEEIVHNGEKVGMVYRTKSKVKPVYISPGHLADFDDTLDIIKSTTGKHRIPEPTRQVHILVNKFRRGEISEGIHTL